MGILPARASDGLTAWNAGFDPLRSVSVASHGFRCRRWGISQYSLEVKSLRLVAKYQQVP